MARTRIPDSIPLRNDAHCSLLLRMVCFFLLLLTSIVTLTPVDPSATDAPLPLSTPDRPGSRMVRRESLAGPGRAGHGHEVFTRFVIVVGALRLAAAAAAVAGVVLAMAMAVVPPPRCRRRPRPHATPQHAQHRHRRRHDGHGCFRVAPNHECDAVICQN